MALIESVQAGVNPYGGAGAATQVNLYAYNGCEELTLGQLVNAVCVRIGVALETESVNKSNLITTSSRRLRALADVLEGVVNGELGYDSAMPGDGYEELSVRQFLVDELGYVIDAEDADGESSGGLPSALESVSDRLAFYARRKGRIDSDTSTSQKDMVDLQTSISRRDVAYSTATNIVRTLGATLQAVASNYA